MKIHNYGNDYVQAYKFKNESVNNVTNQASKNRSEPVKSVPTETTQPAPEAEAPKEGRKANKKKAN